MEEVDRFPVEDDEGNRFEVVVYARIVTHTTTKGKRSELHGGTEMVLSDGRHVNDENGRLFAVNLDREDDDELWKL